MMSLIMLLTNANYFLYSSPGKATVAVMAEEEQESTFPSQNNPAGPDEKSPNAPVSFNEEYVHKQESLQDPFWTNYMFEYMIQQTEKLDLVHFEILSPPPEIA